MKEQSNSIKSLISLQGKVCLVTGAAGRIGKATALALAELGARLVLVDIEENGLVRVQEEIRERNGNKVERYVCDLESDEERQKMIRWVSTRIDRLDVLVNNAGFVGTSDLSGWNVDLEKQSVATWKRALEVNLTSVFSLSKGLKDLLAENKSGSIINIASIYGVCGPDMSLYEGTEMNNPAAYAASKGGLLQLTRWMATVLGPDIRVNAISPGGIHREQPEVFVERYEKRTPLRRMGKEEDVVGAIVYLATDLSSWVTGQNLMVDGGWSVW